MATPDEQAALASFRFGAAPYHDPTGRAHAMSAPASPSTPHSVAHLASFGGDSSASTGLTSPTSGFSPYDTPALGHRHSSQPHRPSSSSAVGPRTPSSLRRRVTTEPYPRPSHVSPRSFSPVSDDDYQAGADDDESLTLSPSKRSTSSSSTGGGGRAPKAARDPGETRSSRLLSERRRRDTVRDHIDDLRNLLPVHQTGPAGSKMTKSKILEKAVQLVIGLKAENEEYAQRLSILEARNQLLNSVLARSGPPMDAPGHAEPAMMGSMPPPSQQQCAGSLSGPSSLSYAMAPQQHQHPHYAPAPVHWSHAPPPPPPALQLRPPQPRHFGGLMQPPSTHHHHQQSSGLVGAGPGSDDGFEGDDMDEGGDSHHLHD